MVQTLIEKIFDQADAFSRQFRQDIDKRRVIRKQMGVELAATLCMDGRVSLSLITGIPAGIITPFRNLGGKYRVGWPLFRMYLWEWANYAYHTVEMPAVLIITYHWSASSEHRGCKAFNYDKEAALAYMLEFQADVFRAFGERIFPVVVGIETDSGRMVIHGKKDDILDTAMFTQFESSFTRYSLRGMLSLNSERVTNALAHLIEGNIRYVGERRQAPLQPVELEHCERVLAIGRGFSWLSSNNPNFAVIIGPCDPDLPEAIATGAGIILDNCKLGRINAEDGGVLLVSSQYRKESERAGIIMEAYELARVAKAAIERDIPDLGGFFRPVVGVTNLNDCSFERLEL